MSDEAERPILFSASMVQAILASRKTMTRRIIKPQPVYALALIGADDKPTGEFGMCMQAERVISKHVRCPYGQTGDLLWVRETHRFTASGDRVGPQKYGPVFYEADQHWFMGQAHEKGRLRPSIHMPRWASRITLRVTDVRVERLHAISEEDAKAEGAEPVLVPPDGGSAPHVEGFREIWERINGPDAWDVNPWVWVVKFERITP